MELRCIMVHSIRKGHKELTKKSEATKVNKLTKEKLILACESDTFDFDTTEDITDTTTIIGQERLSSSMELGVDIPKDGYNIFALGPNETNRLSHIRLCRLVFAELFRMRGKSCLQRMLA